MQPTCDLELKGDIYRSVGQPSGVDAPCFREFSHRVGSSLQTVACLARRAEREIIAGANQATALAALRRVQRSVAAIAFVQRLLYTDTTVRGATRELIEALSSHLRTIYNRPDVEFVIDEAADLPGAHAQTISLILCELITNAFRHGFDETDVGEIRISVAALPPGTIRITVEDDGKGCAGRPQMVPERGLGLVNEFVADACGRVKCLGRDSGIAWQADLPLS